MTDMGGGGHFQGQPGLKTCTLIFIILKKKKKSFRLKNVISLFKRFWSLITAKLCHCACSGALHCHLMCFLFSQGLMILH